MEEVFILMGAN